MISLKSLINKLEISKNNLNTIKTKLANEITKKGITTLSTDSFQKISDNIKSILTERSNKPLAPTASDLYPSSVVITASSGCKIKYNGQSYDSPYTFMGLKADTEHVFYSYQPKKIWLMQSLNSDPLIVKTPKKLQNTISKPIIEERTRNQIYIICNDGKIIINGDTSKVYTSPYNYIGYYDTLYEICGYKAETDDYQSIKSEPVYIKTIEEAYDIVTYSIGSDESGSMNNSYCDIVTNLISTDSLLSICGLSGIGTIEYSGDITFFKVLHMGRVLYIADSVIVSNISWRDLYSKNLLKGININISGNIYLCRTLRGYPRNPATTNTSVGNGLEGITNEWYTCVINRIEARGQEINNYKYTICQEYVIENKNVICGNNREYDVSMSIDEKNIDTGWRPVLELL